MDEMHISKHAKLIMSEISGIEAKTFIQKLIMVNWLGDQKISFEKNLRWPDTVMFTNSLNKNDVHQI